MTIRVYLVFFAAALVLCVKVTKLPASEEGGPSPYPTVSFTRVLAGSEPEYVYICVDTSGQGIYEGRSLKSKSHPETLLFGKIFTQRLFMLTEGLNYFRGLSFKSQKRFANVGEKTLIFRDSGREHKVVYNYSNNRNLRELESLFEKIVNVQQHLALLQHALKFDRLGLAAHLRKIQVDLQKKAIADPQQLVPTLKQIASNPRLLNLAQNRAQSILEKLRQAE